MASGATGVLDQARQRPRQTDPQHEGSPSTHGPMAAEAKPRHGHGAEAALDAESFPYCPPGSLICV